MCVVSAVTDYGMTKMWPNPVPYQPWVNPEPANPDGYFQRLNNEEVRKIREFLKLVDTARLVDMLSGQPDCPDPDKVEWLAQLEARLAALEATIQPENEENVMKVYTVERPGGVTTVVRGTDVEFKADGVYISNHGSFVAMFASGDYLSVKANTIADDKELLLG